MGLGAPKTFLDMKHKGKRFSIVELKLNLQLSLPSQFQVSDHQQPLIALVFSTLQLPQKRKFKVIVERMRNPDRKI